jgi:hypothetical protein
MLVNQRALDFLSSFEWKGVPIDVELANAPLRGAWVYPDLFTQARGPSNVRSNSITRLDAFGDFMHLYVWVWKRVVYHKKLIAIFLISLLIALSTALK